MRAIITFVLLISSACVPFTASAGDLYLLGGIGLLKTPGIQDATPSEDPGNVFSFTAGWKIKRTIAVELTYDRIGQITYKTPVLDPSTGMYTNKEFNRNVGSSIEISALYLYPVTTDGVSLIGKLGAANTNYTYSNPNNLSNVPSDYSKTSALIGAGVQYEGPDGTTLRLMASRKSAGTSIIGSVGFTF